MRSLLLELSGRVSAAMKAMGVDGDPLVRPAQDAQFGDFQCNAAMGLAKKLGRKPRDVANDLIKNLRLDDLCDTPEVAGPGFINFRIKPAALAGALGSIPATAGDPKGRLGIPPSSSPYTVCVDFCAPNLAKEMHVGHLRSTVIGDFVSRVLEFDGHNVIRENHVGDWGTQFGMLVAFLLETRPEVSNKPDALEIADLESFYVQAKARFDSDEAFKTKARETVVKLQQGDPATRRIWKAFCDESLRHCHAICDRLGVTLIDRGESFYDELQGEVVRRLEKRLGADDGLVRVSDGALCVFMDRFKGRENEILPLIVRKSDGGYNYATSDLATILHRVETLGARRVVYVVGITQKQHLEMVFAAARACGFVGSDVSLEHLGFGSVLSASGKPFKTREGGTIKLRDLLDEAVDKARSVIEKPASDDDAPRRALAEAEAGAVAEAVGLGAVKYFDLSHALQTDYKFDFDTILALDGNTAPYMMYAYARVRSIARKAGVDFASLPADAPFVLEHPAELALGKRILGFVDVMGTLTRELRSNTLTDYLYDLSKDFSRFYDKRLGVRVIDASPEDVRLSRLKLCDLTARVLRLGLELLGIKVVEQM